MQLPPTVVQVVEMRFDDRHRAPYVVVPHSEDRSDDPALLSVPEFDYHFAVGMTHVNVRWRVLTRWREDDQPEAGDAQDGGQ